MAFNQPFSVPEKQLVTHIAAVSSTIKANKLPPSSQTGLRIFEDQNVAQSPHSHWYLVYAVYVLEQLYTTEHF